MQSNLQIKSYTVEPSTGKIIKIRTNENVDYVLVDNLKTLEVTENGTYSDGPYSEVVVDVE